MDTTTTTTTTPARKKVLGIHNSAPPHWVGDGFPVRTLFGYDGLGRQLSPFLMLDHAAPTRFAPAARPRGVGPHPHRGFETVTIVYQGALEHRDSTGGGGRIGPGDVQWMTAGAGIVHDEFHAADFSASGGMLEMVQLWVNLPARDKMTAPGYQAIRNSDIPSVALPDGAGTLRVIAGACAGRTGPARTFTPMNVWDLRLVTGGQTRLQLDDGHTAALVVLRGTVLVNDEAVAREGQLVHLARAGEALWLEANNDATLLLLGGAPIDEPIVGHGPFVMNSHAEIAQAIADFHGGRFGTLAPEPRAQAAAGAA